MASLWAFHGLALMLAMKALLDRAPRETGWRRIALFMAAPAAFAVLQTALDMLATQMVGPLLLGGVQGPPGVVVSPVGVAFDFTFKLNLRVYLWIFGFYAAALALMGSAAETYAARLKADQAEIEALRLQVNPHLLFNSLNSISALILQGDHRRAEVMTLGLARFYRGNLAAGEAGLVALEEEIEALEAYVDLEKLRLDRLVLEVDCPDALAEARVPVLILQPLVENAIKYGVTGASEPTPIRLRVRSQGDTLRIAIENHLSEYPDTDGAGIGLSNVRSRLRSYFQDRAAMVAESSPDQWRVTLVLPLLPQATQQQAPSRTIAHLPLASAAAR
ncbi:sensor histidine kinase [Caulobacter radicis]|uniref:sensor histidine kinase n=1 Tax=Caulobacter radicis TaxID=2172650 RepID=UPI0014021271|nr:histidine kinase [Caulobacter radicis]